jgi:hypothetical protein
MVIELGWLKSKVNIVLIENEWQHMLVGGGENEVTSLKLTKHYFYSQIPGHLGTVIFIDGDENMNNSRERNRVHPWTDYRATCLSRGRRRV